MKTSSKILFKEQRQIKTLTVFVVGKLVKVTLDIHKCTLNVKVFFLSVAAAEEFFLSHFSTSRSLV